MTIISACKLVSGYSSLYYVVFDTPYAGAYISTAILQMNELDFEMYQPDVKMFDTREEAHKYAEEYAFGPESWPDSWKEV